MERAALLQPPFFSTGPWQVWQGNFTYTHVLSVVEIGMVRKIVDPNPLNWTLDFWIQITCEGWHNFFPLFSNFRLSVGIKAGDVFGSFIFLFDPGCKDSFMESSG